MKQCQLLVRRIIKTSLNAQNIHTIMLFAKKLNNNNDDKRAWMFNKRHTGEDCAVGTTQ